LEQYGIDIQKLNSIDSEELVGINQFFKRLSFIDFDLENEKVKGVYERFLKELRGIIYPLELGLFPLLGFKKARWIGSL